MNESLEILPLILGASVVVKAVMALLVVLSLIGWLLIFRLTFRLNATAGEDEDFQAWFDAHNNPPKIYQSVAADANRAGLAEVFFLAYQNYNRLLPIVKKSPTSKDDIISALERTLRSAIGRQQSELESGLATLASIASVSPYIGLFGTVWGIMSAFIGLSSAESVSLATVAPGIAEALIATAMGLFAAIPASLGFNHFSAKAANIYDNRALFCDELTGIMQRHHLQNHHQ